MKHIVAMITIALCVLVSYGAATIVLATGETIIAAVSLLPEPEEPVVEAEPDTQPNYTYDELYGEPVFERLLEQMPYEAKRFQSDRDISTIEEVSRSATEEPSRSAPEEPSRTNYDDDWGGWRGHNGRPYWFPDATFPHHIDP